MKRQLNKGGFTLVELMVVVAIIGILSAVAVPNFRKYQAKSKTSEAKLQLASVYMAQTSHQLDYTQYDTCMEFMGFDDPVNNYYALGFDAAWTTAYPDRPTACATDSVTFAFPAEKRAGGSANATTANLIAQVAAISINNTANTFVAGAIGFIEKDNATAASGDIWTINQNKQMQHVRVGY